MSFIKNYRRLSFALLLALLAPSAFAHGPTRQKATDEIEISASPAEVWKVVGDFASLEKWHPAVASSPATQGSTLGSVRTVTFKSGGQMEEGIEGFDPDNMVLKYRARDGGALPVTNYNSTMIVMASGTGSKVVWRGAFYRGFPNNDPPPELNDEAAVKAVAGLYRTGLTALKAFIEKK